MILNRKIYALARGRKAIYIGFDKVEGEISKELLSELEEYLMRRRKEFSFEPDFSIYEGEVRRVLEYVYENVKYGETRILRRYCKEPKFKPTLCGLCPIKEPTSDPDPLPQDNLKEKFGRIFCGFGS